jgi:hypothetical protein
MLDKYTRGKITHFKNGFYRDSPARSKHHAKGSKEVERIDKIMVEKILEEMVNRGDYRAAVFTHLLFNCVKISDVLKMKRSTLYYDNGIAKQDFSYTENSSSKTITVFIHDESFRNALHNYYEEISAIKNDFLFYATKTNRPLGAGGVYFIFQKYKNDLKLKQLSAMSIRKAGIAERKTTATRGKQ